MRVMASDIDGCLASAAGSMDKRLREHFAIDYDPIDPDKFHFHDKYNLNKDEVKAFLFSDKCFDDPDLWLAAEPMRENIEEMVRWCLTGMVPSLITARPPRMRMVTEKWAAKNGVPYSNLLLGCDDKGQICYHIDASFMIEDSTKDAMMVAERGIKCYLIKHTYNVEFEATDLIIPVESYKEIGELEKI